MIFPTSDPIIVYTELCFSLYKHIILNKDTLLNSFLEDIDKGVKKEADLLLRKILSKDFDLVSKIASDELIDFLLLQTWIGALFEEINQEYFWLFEKHIKDQDKQLDFKNCLNDRLIEIQEKIRVELCNMIQVDCAITWIFFNAHFKKYKIFNTDISLEEDLGDENGALFDL